MPIVSEAHLIDSPSFRQERKAESRIEGAAEGAAIGFSVGVVLSTAVIYLAGGYENGWELLPGFTWGMLGAVIGGIVGYGAAG